MKRSRNRRLDRVRRSPSIYSRTEEQAKAKNNRPLFLYFLILLFIGALGYLVFLSPYLKVSKVVINELKYCDKNQIDSIVTNHGKNILNKNIITFQVSNLEKKIGENSGVKSVKVKRNISKKEILVNIEEKKPSFVWETVGKKFLIDENGLVIGNYEEKFKELPNIIDSKNVPVNVGTQIVPKSFPRFIDELAKDFNIYTSTNIVKIEVPEITSEIKVISSANWHALFDTTRTAKGQLVNLGRIISEVQAKKKKLEYVDLRIDNRIFYK